VVDVAHGFFLRISKLISAWREEVGNEEEKLSL